MTIEAVAFDIGGVLEQVSDLDEWLEGHCCIEPSADHGAGNLPVLPRAES